MRTKNSDISVKIFLVVVAVIIVGIIVAWSTGVIKDKRKELNDGTERINNAISSMAEFDLLVYDGGTITGSLLLELIKSNEFGDVEIRYKTLANPSVSPSPYPNADPGVSAKEYINPNGIFEGKIKRDDNGVITALEFYQQE